MLDNSPWHESLSSVPRVPGSQQNGHVGFAWRVFLFCHPRSPTLREAPQSWQQPAGHQHQPQSNSALLATNVWWVICRGKGCCSFCCGAMQRVHCTGHALSIGHCTSPMNEMQRVELRLSTEGACQPDPCVCIYGAHDAGGFMRPS